MFFKFKKKNNKNKKVFRNATLGLVSLFCIYVSDDIPLPWKNCLTRCYLIGAIYIYIYIYIGIGASLKANIFQLPTIKMLKY